MIKNIDGKHSEIAMEALAFKLPFSCKGKVGNLVLSPSSSRQQKISCRKKHKCFASLEVSNSQNAPVVVIDNYDSFTYNLCQVKVFLKFSLCAGCVFPALSENILSVIVFR